MKGVVLDEVVLAKVVLEGVVLDEVVLAEEVLEGVVLDEVVLAEEVLKNGAILNLRYRRLGDIGCLLLTPIF